METMELMPARIKIASILKKALFSGEYKSGDELSLTDIAARLGVSRTPVREAFQQLESEGLIELRMNKGAIVKPIDEHYIRDHYEMRILLEAEAARRAAVNGMDNADDLLKLLHRTERIMEDLSNEEYEDVNQRVHSAIWKASGNDRLSKMLQSLWNGPSIGMLTPPLEHYKASTEEHIAIVEAIKAGDADAAKREMERHIGRSLENILEGGYFK